MFVVFTSRHRDFLDIEEISHTHLPSRFTGERSQAIYEHIRESFAKACKDDELPWCVQGFGSDGDSGRYKVQHIRTPRTYALTSQAMGVFSQFGEGLMTACGLCEGCVIIFNNAMNNALEKYEWACKESTLMVNNAWKTVVEHVDEGKITIKVMKKLIEETAKEKCGMSVEDITCFFNFTLREFFKPQEKGAGKRGADRRRAALTSALENLPELWFRHAACGFEFLGSRDEKWKSGSRKGKRMLTELHFQDTLHNIGK